MKNDQLELENDNVNMGFPKRHIPYIPYTDLRKDTYLLDTSDFVVLRQFQWNIPNTDLIQTFKMSF